MLLRQHMLPNLAPRSSWAALFAVSTLVGTPELCARRIVTSIGNRMEAAAARLIAALAEPGSVRLPRLLAFLRVLLIFYHAGHLPPAPRPRPRGPVAESLDDIISALAVNACGLDHALSPVGPPKWERVLLRFSLFKENSGSAIASVRSISDAA